MEHFKNTINQLTILKHSTQQNTQILFKCTWNTYWDRPYHNSQKICKDSLKLYSLTTWNYKSLKISAKSLTGNKFLDNTWLNAKIKTEIGKYFKFRHKIEG